MMPLRLQRRRVRGAQLPPGTVVVTRPTKWGNPYPIPDNADDLALERIRNEYVAHLNAELARGTLDLSELRGKNLACWCRPDAPWCHADELLRRANG